MGRNDKFLMPIGWEPSPTGKMSGFPVQPIMNGYSYQSCYLLQHPFQ